MDKAQRYLVFVSSTAEFMRDHATDPRYTTSKKALELSKRFDAITLKLSKDLEDLPPDALRLDHGKHEELERALLRYQREVRRLLTRSLADVVKRRVNLQLTTSPPSLKQCQLILDSVLAGTIYSDPFSTKFDESQVARAVTGPAQLDSPSLKFIPGNAGQSPDHPSSQSQRRKPELHFALNGEGAHGKALIVGATAALDFRYGVPGPSTLASVDDAALDAARIEDADVGLTVTPDEGLRIEGPQTIIARFRNRRLSNPVSFALRAVAKGPTASGVHVAFHRSGDLICEQHIAIPIVAKSSTVSAKAPVTAALQPSAIRPIARRAQRRMVLKAFIDGGELHLALDEYNENGDFLNCMSESANKGSADIGKLLEKVQARLGDFYQGPFWAAFTGDGAEDRGPLDRALRQVAVAGHAMYRDLCECPSLAPLLDRIDQAPDGTRLTIQTRSVFLPWEIMYPRPATSNPHDPDRTTVERAVFWGVRFAIETVSMSNGSYEQCLDAQRACPPVVSANLDTTIALGEPAEQPEAIHNRWLERIGKKAKVDRNVDCPAISHALTAVDADASLIYVYCHGSRTAPLGGSTEERLTFSDACSITPDDLALASGRKFKNGPVVFLNSCWGGAFSPLSFSTFLSRFRQMNALGLIATTFPVPICFAAHFGEAVVDAYLQRPPSLAESIRQLRATHLSRGNPVPLFYSVQCQLGF